jgi:hypothetical protein
MIELLRPLLNWTEAIVAGIALYAFAPMARRVVGALRLKRLWKRRLLKLIPAGQIIGWSIYGIWLIKSLVGTDGVTPNVIAVGTVLGVITVASWFAVRDILGGAILRAEDVYEPGEWLRVGDSAGRIRKVGTRSLEMEMENGRRLRVPYSLLAGAAIVKAEPIGSATAHSFRIRAPRTASVPELKALIQRAALLSTWSSAARRPRVETTTPTTDAVELDITVYAIHPDYDLAVENAVRAAPAVLQVTGGGSSPQPPVTHE